MIKYSAGPSARVHSSHKELSFNPKFLQERVFQNDLYNGQAVSATNSCSLSAAALRFTAETTATAGKCWANQERSQSDEPAIDTPPILAVFFD